MSILPLLYIKKIMLNYFSVRYYFRVILLILVLFFYVLFIKLFVQNKKTNRYIYL